jgi:hypothetical protein
MRAFRRILTPIRPRSLTCNADGESCAWLAGWEGLETIEELVLSAAPLPPTSLPRVRRLHSYGPADGLDAPRVRELRVGEIGLARILSLAELETLEANRIPPELARLAPARLSRVVPDPSRRWADFRRYTWTD